MFGKAAVEVHRLSASADVTAVEVEAFENPDSHRPLPPAPRISGERWKFRRSISYSRLSNSQILQGAHIQPGSTQAGRLAATPPVIGSLRGRASL